MAASPAVGTFKGIFAALELNEFSALLALPAAITLIITLIRITHLIIEHNKILHWSLGKLFASC